MSQYPLLPLDAFRRIIGYHPFHFWGLANNTIPISSACSTIVAEYAYQNANAVGRSEIRQAILDAENLLLPRLQYSVAPRYAEQTVQYPANVWSPVDLSGRWLSVMIPQEGYVQTMGIEARTLLGTPAVTYSDADGDGVNDTFTLTIATTETDVRNLAAYFQASDRLDGAAVSERYRIEPLQISISGGTATIKGRSWLLVEPIHYEGYTQQQAIDPSDTTKFATNLEVYTRKTNADGVTNETAQGLFIWETMPYPSWACCNAGDPAGLSYGIARVGIRDSLNGLVAPGEAVYADGSWSANSPLWGTECRAPDHVTLRYLAGAPLLADGQMQPRLQTLVARLAMAQLATRICGCDVANRELYHWQYDLSKIGSATEQYAITRSNLGNPFGTRRGETFAWQEVQDLRLVRGVPH